MTSLLSLRHELAGFTYMCMQCVAGAMTAGAAATGARAWIFSRAGAWLTPRRKVFLTRALLAAAVLAAGLIGPSAT